MSLESTIKVIRGKPKENNVTDEENNRCVIDQYNKLLKLSDMKVVLHI